MNAVLRENDEVIVLSNEAVEVHLTYLRSGLDAVQKALPVLRDKIDLLAANVDSKLERTNARIDAVHSALSSELKQTNKDLAAGNALLAAKIDKANEDRAAADALLSAKIDKANEDRAAADALLSAKIDKANEDRAAGDAALGAKIDKLCERVLEIQGLQKAIVWVISLASVVSAAVSIAHTFSWI